MNKLILTTIFFFLLAATAFAQNAGITIGDSNEATDGTVRYNAAGFEGLHLGQWLPFTGTNTTASPWTISGSDVYYTGGNVGIGTVPTENFHLLGNALFDGTTTVKYLNPGLVTSDYKFLRFGTDTAFYAGFMWNNSSPTFGNGDDFTIFTYGNRDIVFNPGNGNSLFMTGNVGIGTMTPTSKLDVNGDVATGAIFTSEGRLELGDNGTGDRISYIDFHSNDVEPDYTTRMVRWPGEGGNFLIRNRGNSNFLITNQGTGHLAFSTADTERMRIQNDGKVRVGNITSTPGAYNLYVKTGILTERVKIATMGSADWADYVFAEDYKLLSLDEVKAFVQTNKHLPNVPSAQDIEKNGYELQQMDAKLLEKIEELYLLTIQLNEEKKELKKENEQLKKNQTAILNRLSKLEKQ